MRLINYSCIEEKSPKTNLNEVKIDYKNYSCRRTGSGGNRWTDGKGRRGEWRKG